MATANTTYVSDTGKSYDFNTATKLNSLLVKALSRTQASSWPVSHTTWTSTTSS